ncbi:MAG TPA: WecB/TagA/CpsF family glycosyltransferase [archaeon]|nr:WecB/TagA/CpsF family glycosyltransferase [archaeon]HPV65861.1 WecB/TagA/CpsF family glycosyltransferase [archaeon]
MKKLLFSKKNPINLIKTNSNKIFNFLNNESLWHYKNNKLYADFISNENNINFPDGKYISSKLNLKQQRGPSITKCFILSNFAKSKKHFFIANCNRQKLNKITGIPLNNIEVYNPPYISEFEFSEDIKTKMLRLIKKFNPDYIWVAIGAPKQEILSNQLFSLYKCKYINIGAAIDFLTKDKSEAPRIWVNLKIEWLYRLITDFKHSKKKVYRSIIGLRYLKCIDTKK